MRRTTRLLVIGMMLRLANAVATGSTDPDFVDCRATDGSGPFYVVVRRLGGPEHEYPVGPVEILVGRAALGSEPVERANGVVKAVDRPLAPLGFVTVVEATVGVRDGDQIVGRLHMEKPPRRVLLDGARSQLICIDEFGMNIGVKDGGPALQVFTFNGKKAFSKTLKEMFSEREAEQFSRGTFGVDWFRDAWIDPQESEIVLLAAEEQDFLGVLEGLPPTARWRKINLRSGEVAVWSDEDVLQALRGTHIDITLAAVNAARERRITAALSDLKKLSESAAVELRDAASAAYRALYPHGLCPWGDFPGGTIIDPAYDE